MAALLIILLLLLPGAGKSSIDNDEIDVAIDRLCSNEVQERDTACDQLLAMANRSNEWRGAVIAALMRVAEDKDFMREGKKRIASWYDSADLLGLLKAKEAVAPLNIILLTTNSLEVRKKTAKVLGQIGDRQARAALMRDFVFEKDEITLGIIAVELSSLEFTADKQSAK